MSIIGWRNCGLFSEACRVAREVQGAQRRAGRCVNVSVEVFPHRKAFQEWLRANQVGHGQKLGDRAAAHMTSPFVVVDGEFVGALATTSITSLGGAEAYMT